MSDWTIINFLRLEIKMKCLTKAFISIMALATLAESKLVVYGPQELIDKFNDKTKDDLGDNATGAKNKSKCRYTHVLQTVALTMTIHFCQ